MHREYFPCTPSHRGKRHRGVKAAVQQAALPQNPAAAWNVELGLAELGMDSNCVF